MIDTRDHSKRLPDLLAAALCVALLAAIVPGYPLGSLWLGAALAAYGALLLRWPGSWLLLVPAALPVLDLAPWTGRFYLDEFDALLATTVLAQAWRGRYGARASGALAPAARAALLLFAVSTCAALLIGAWPLRPPGLNGLNHYYSPYNGVRMAKGLAWALLLWPPLRHSLARDVAGTQHRFALGMGLGVAAAALGVVWERLAFTGLFNFDSGYRVVGLFSAMHIGGSYIEAYFALALPFVAWWTLATRGLAARVAGAAMLVLGSYALLVTYARAGYLAAAIGLLVLAATALLQRRLRHGHALRAALLCAGVVALGWTIGHGDTMQRRYAVSLRDLELRAAHWADALRMIDPAPRAWLAGMGLGSYPRIYFLRSGEGVAPSYLALRAEPGNTWLGMAAGTPLYLEQLVSVAPGRYRFSVRARSADADARLAVPLCEKWMLYSRRCIWHTIAVGDTGGRWQNFSATLVNHALGKPGQLVARPLKLSLFNPAEGSEIEVDNVSLVDEHQRELLRNGDFSAGMDGWFFTSDNHQPWHLENAWLQLVFEQGLVGLAAFGALLLAAGAALARRLRARDAHAPVLAAALAAFLALSPFDSVFDFPRLALLVYLILLQAAFDGETTMPEGN